MGNEQTDAMTTTWAAKVLEGVEVHIAGHYGEAHRVILEADALAAIAKMGAGDGLVERLLQSTGLNGFTREPVRDKLKVEAANKILAMGLQLEEAQAERDKWEADWNDENDAWHQVLLRAEAAEAERDAVRERVARLEGAHKLMGYVLQDDLCNRLTPRVIDIAYSAFMIGRSGKNKDDGGPCDWFNDTRPMVLEKIGEIRAALTEGGKDG